MATNAVTPFPSCRESRISHTPVYSGVDELNHHNNSRNNRRDSNYSIRIQITEMVWRQYYAYLRNIWRFSRFRFNLYYNNSWLRFLIRSNRQSSQSNRREDRNRPRNRNYCYYYLLVYLLTIGIPVKAEEGETNNTSNPVAAATGNVTNQAVQFQNNGAPSRQVYGPNISCNGATMTFSPFYMGNHTTPYDEHMDQQSYTVAENWGGQINFMVPLDGSLVERCKAIADRLEEKMRLDYELVRALKCAELMQKGFMIRPRTRVAHMCQDIIPISLYKKEQKFISEQPKTNPLFNPQHNGTINQAHPFRIP